MPVASGIAIILLFAACEAAAGQKPLSAGKLTLTLLEASISPPARTFLKTRDFRLCLFGAIRPGFATYEYGQDTPLIDVQIDGMLAVPLKDLT